MRTRDTGDVVASLAAVLADAAAVCGGFLLATWLRFNSGWIPLHDAPPPHLYFMYGWGAGMATLLFLFLFRALGLFVRPQTGRFETKVPRLIRATALGLLLTSALAFAARTTPPYSRLTLGLSFFTILLLVLVERYLCFRVELYWARHSRVTNRVLIVGTDAVASRLARVLRKEPRLRSQVVGFLTVGAAAPAADIAAELIRGTAAELEPLAAAQPVDQVIVCDAGIGERRLVEIILFCERNLISFNLVPDLCRILTSRVDVQTIADIPLLGLSRWPLDLFWNRMVKRLEDVLGALVGLVLFAPVMALAALLVRRTSPGPAFYRQTRCGEQGRAFTLYKLRTMRQDAERQTGPVWAAADDPRCTPVGAFLRRHNLDELPQFWNVLRGDMSLVGPRPERPHFVEQFKEDISRYMWRHVCRPGMTGWAQVNGLRGNTSIEDRIKYDLYYLENWSLTFDFKILLRTLPARKNAY